MGSVREMGIMWALLAIFGVWQYSSINGSSGRITTLLSPKYVQTEPQLVAAVQSIQPAQWKALPPVLQFPEGDYSATPLADGMRWTLTDGGAKFATITARVDGNWFGGPQVWFDFVLLPGRHSPQATAAINDMPMPHDIVQITGDYLLADSLRLNRSQMPSLLLAQTGIARESQFAAGRYANYMKMHMGTAMDQPNAMRVLP